MKIAAILVIGFLVGVLTRLLIEAVASTITRRKR